MTIGMVGLAALLAGGAAPDKNRPSSAPAQSGDSWDGPSRPAGPRGFRDRRGSRWSGREPLGDGDHGRPFERPSRAAPDRELTSQEIEQVMALTEQEFPLIHRRFDEARKKGGPMFQRMMGDVGPHMLRLARIREDNPRLAEKMIAQHRNEMEVFDLRRQYDEAVGDPQRRGEIRAKLRAALARSFEHRLERLRGEIEMFEQRLERARADLKRQEEQKDALIDEHLNQMIEAPPFPPSPPRERFGPR
jgi:hypothetical protein